MKRYRMRDLRQLQKLPLRMRLRRKALPVSVEGNERFTNEPAERVEARAGTRLASSRCVVVQRDEDVVKKMLKQFIADESGATAIEYGLIAAGIAIAIVPALNGSAVVSKAKFTTISTSLK